jgi:hypothetical protein
MLITGQRSARNVSPAFLLALSRCNRRSGCDPTAFEPPMTRADVGNYLEFDDRDGKPHPQEAQSPALDGVATQQ